MMDKPHRHALAAVEVYTQDGDDVEPQDGEQFVELYLRGRYYGVDYERGDYPLYMNLASWLEARLPGCEVWYGGDSSGVVATRFDATERDRVWRHFVLNGHRPYLNHRYMSSRHAPMCDFCHAEMWQQGFGRNYEKWTCQGCQSSIVTSDDGTTWVPDNTSGL
jgi:hypothetical protein